MRSPNTKKGKQYFLVFQVSFVFFKQMWISADIIYILFISLFSVYSLFITKEKMNKKQNKVKCRIETIRAKHMLALNLLLLKKRL